MKWLGRKKENRWKKEREKEEEKRTQKWRKSKRSEQTFQRFRADTGKLASSELTSFEFPNGPNTRRERERKGNEKNVSMLVYACRMERDAGWGKRKSSARYFNEGSLEHRGRSFILRVRQLFWCWKLRNCWFRRSMRVGRREEEERGRDGGGKSRKKVGRGSGTSGSGDSSTSSEGKRKRASRKEAVKLIQTRRYDEINEERERKRRDRMRRGTRVSSCFARLARSLWASWRGKNTVAGDRA